MPLEGKYEPSTQQWVRDQVELIESSGGTKGAELRGMPVIVMTNRGAKSGRLRKTPLMRVEHEGVYAAVGSQGGAPADPAWVANLRAEPLVELQDGPVKKDYIAREITGDEKREWWRRAVDAFPPYREYQAKTKREIPVFLLEPIEG
jgi:deazaflavin-dependent oxidoreductase (nitroreductase family)